METEKMYIEIIDKLSQVKGDREKLVLILNHLNQIIRVANREESPDIPYEYESIVTQITEAVLNGFICFFNPQTLEIEQVADEGFYGFTEAEFDEQNEDMVDEYGLTYPGWESYVRFEPFSRDDLLDRIDAFIEDLGDEKLKAQLEDFSDTQERIKQFPGILERTGYTRDWNVFIRGEIESSVKEQLIETLEKKTDSEDDIYSLSTSS